MLNPNDKYAQGWVSDWTVTFDDGAKAKFDMIRSECITHWCDGACEVSLTSVYEYNTKEIVCKHNSIAQLERVLRLRNFETLEDVYITEIFGDVSISQIKETCGRDECAELIVNCTVLH